MAILVSRIFVGYIFIGRKNRQSQNSLVAKLVGRNLTSLLCSKLCTRLCSKLCTRLFLKLYTRLFSKLCMRLFSKLCSKLRSKLYTLYTSLRLIISKILKAKSSLPSLSPLRYSSIIALFYRKLYIGSQLVCWFYYNFASLLKLIYFSRSNYL